MLNFKQFINELHTPEQLEAAEKRHTEARAKTARLADRLSKNVDKVKSVENQSTAKNPNKKYYYTNLFTKQKNRALHKVSQHDKALAAIKKLRNPKSNQQSVEKVKSGFEAAMTSTSKPETKTSNTNSSPAPRKKPTVWQALKYAWSH